MTFLNIALLGGAFAFLAPLAIHLLNRSRFRSVDWGAMQLLESAIEQNTRSFQWESILLLILRCLIPILLAFCLARPALTSLQTSIRGEMAVAVLLDDSLSMAAAQNSPAANSDGERTNLEIAKSQISAFIDDNPRAEKSLALASTSEATNLDVTLDNFKYSNWLEKVVPDQGTSNFQLALENCLRQLGESKRANRQLLLFSDFSESEWSAARRNELESIKELVDGQTQITLIPVSTNQEGNVSVHIAEPEFFRSLPDEPVTAAFQVRNWGKSPIQVPVELFLDDKLVSTEQVSIETNSEERVQLTTEFPKIGTHVIRCIAKSNDGLSLDDSASMIVEVRRATTILHVRNDSSGVNFLSAALAPFKGDFASRNGFEIRSIEARRFANELKSRRFELVVLEDVHELNPAATQALVEFVEEGGGLISIGISALDEAWYNSVEASKSEAKLFPLAFAETLPHQNGLEVARETLQLPELQVFNQSNAGSLSELRFTQTKSLKSHTYSDSKSTAMIALRLSNGDPLIAVHRCGKGTVIQCGFGLRKDDSNILTQPVFVPLTQRLAHAATSKASNPNITSQSAITLSRELVESSEQADVLFKSDPAQFTATFFENESKTTIRPTQVGLFLTEDAISPNAISVSPQTNESDPAKLASAELQKLADSLNAKVVSDIDEFQQSRSTQENGREIWRWLVACLLLFLFAETLLAKRITGGSN